MKKGIHPLIIANWKMNPQSRSLAKRTAMELKKKLSRVTDVDVVLAPAYPHLEVAHGVLNGNDTFTLGAQNVHFSKLGAFTGEVSIPMLEDFGVTTVIVGHSERRALGEKDALINEKLMAVVKAGLTGIFCVGEAKRDHNGHYLSHIEAQVRAGLSHITRAKLPQVVIGYEPIWAVGTGVTPTPEDIYEMKLFIEKILSDLYDRNTAQKIRIIYGGSVTDKNAKTLHQGGQMDGFLVGGASLHPDEFFGIVTATRSV